MRYILGAIFICALAAPAASAAPMLDLGPVSASKTERVTLIAKRAKAQSQRQTRSNGSGIHPLVGSGDY